MPKISFVVGSLGGGGQERQLTNLIRALRDLGLVPSVAVWRFNSTDRYVSEVKALGSSVFRVDQALGMRSSIPSLRSFLRCSMPAFVHSYSLQTNFPTWLASLGLPVVPVGSIRGDYWETRRTNSLAIRYLCYRFPSGLIANSLKATMDARAHKGPVGPRRVEYVPNGIATIEEKTDEHSVNDCFTVIGAGRFDENKNWSMLLKSMHEFSLVYKQEWELKLCGDGPTAPKLKAFARELGIQENVHFPGFVEDISRTMQSASVVALTSKSEGTPNVLMEAMACGRPSVTTDVGDAAELIQHGVNGFVVGDFSATTFAECLLCLARDPELRRRMGQSARRQIAENYSLEKLAARTISAYSRLQSRIPIQVPS